VQFTEPIPDYKKLGAITPADLVVKSADFTDLTGDKPLDAGADPAKLKNLPVPAEPK
jgi:hypothetical protein